MTNKLIFNFFMATVMCFMAALAIGYVNSKEANIKIQAAYDQVQARQNQLWCEKEVLAQADAIPEVYADHILEVYQVCLNNPDEFPLNAFEATNRPYNDT